MQGFSCVRVSALSVACKFGVITSQFYYCLKQIVCTFSSVHNVHCISRAGFWKPFPRRKKRHYVCKKQASPQIMLV